MTIRPVRRRPAEEDAFFVCGPVFLFIIVLVRLVRDEDNPTKGQVASQGHSAQWAQSHPSRPICRRTTRSSIVGSLRPRIRRRAHGVYHHSQLLSLATLLHFLALAGISFSPFLVTLMSAPRQRISQSLPGKEQIMKCEIIIYVKGIHGHGLGSWELKGYFFRQVTIWQAANEVLDSEFGRRPTLWSCLLAVFSCPLWP